MRHLRLLKLTKDWTLPSEWQNWFPHNVIPSFISSSDAKTKTCLFLNAWRYKSQGGDNEGFFEFHMEYYLLYMCWKSYGSIPWDEIKEQTRDTDNNNDHNSPAQYRCADSGKLERNLPNLELLGPAEKTRGSTITSNLDTKNKTLERLRPKTSADKFTSQQCDDNFLMNAENISRRRKKLIPFWLNQRTLKYT